MRRLVAGVDTSTQSCKVELRDAVDFSLVASGSAPHPPASPPSSEQDPQAWWDAFVTALGRARAQTPEAEIVAISVAGQCHGLVALDDHDEVIRPAKLWNDTTTTVELDQLRHRIGDGEFIATVGSLPTAAFTISKVAWLASREPHHFARMAHMLLPHDYLTFRLTGEYVTDRSEASGTGYFDSASNRYVLDFLRAIDPGVEWEGMVPRVAGPDEVVGVVLNKVAEQLGLRAGTIVGAGGGDQHASAVGLGLRRAELVVALGTSGVVLTPAPDPVHDTSGLVNGVAAMHGGYLPLVCTLNAAKVTDTFARLLGVGVDELSALALAADAKGPVLVAHLDGERTPNLPGASGTLVDLRTDSTREQLARAAFEGVIHGLKVGVACLDRVGVDTSGMVFVVGGGAKSPAYAQLLSNSLGRPVHVAEVGEAVARGAALQAMALSAGAPLTQAMLQWRPPHRVIAHPAVPHEGRWERYLEASAVMEPDALAPRG